MLDIDLISKPLASLNGLLVYRCETAFLRREMTQCIADVAVAMGGLLLPIELSDLITWWSSPGLIEGIRFCDISRSGPLNREQLNQLRTVLKEPPAVPTVIFLSTKVEKSLALLRQGITVMDEARFNVKNFGVGLSFLERQSGLLAGFTAVTEQAAVQLYFRAWIGERGTVTLAELSRAFDEAMLLYLDRTSGRFEVPSKAEYLTRSPAYIVRSLKSLLETSSNDNIANLCRALAIKSRQGWLNVELAIDLCRATAVLRRSVERSEGLRSAYWLWAVLLALWSESFCKSASVEESSECSHLLIGIDRLCRDFRTRSRSIGSDPLAGKWKSIAALAQGADLNSDDLDAACSPVLLLHSVSKCLKLEDERPWLARLRAVVAQGCAMLVTQEPVRLPIRQQAFPVSFGQIIGRGIGLHRIELRFRDGLHHRPLVLAGPQGVGKSQIARLYAKSLICEAPRPPGRIEPCGYCDACVDFDKSGGFGYIELDLRRENILDSVYKHVEALHRSPLSDHRVIVLNYVEVSPHVIDVFLKSFEDRALRTTFILLANDKAALSAACVSRSDVIEMNGLAREDARRIALQWIPYPAEEEVFELLFLASGGRPKEIQWICETLGPKPVTLEAAQRAAGVGWGRQALAYWSALMRDDDFDETAIRPPKDLPINEAIDQIRSALISLMHRAALREPAFLGLESEICRISDTLDNRCDQIGLSRDALEGALIRHWLSDDVVDERSFIAAGLEARDILAGNNDNYAL